MKRQGPMEEIIAHVCKEYELEHEALVGPGANRQSSEARAMIALLVRHEAGLSFTGLGKQLSGISSVGVLWWTYYQPNNDLL